MSDFREEGTGKFLPGYKGGPGRPKGSRNKMTQLMLDRVAARSEDGLSPEEVMLDIMQDPNMPPELRLKAATQITNLVHPKASSIEVRMDEDSSMSNEQIEQRIMQLIALSDQE